MSTLTEIEAAVENLPPSQQEALYSFLTEQIRKHRHSSERHQAFAAWLQVARGAGEPGASTKEIMQDSRGEA